MRITVDIDHTLVTLAKIRAAKKNETVSDVIEESLKRFLPAEMNVKLTGNPKNMKLEFVESAMTASEVSKSVT